MLQEIKCTNDEFPDLYTSFGYELIVNGQKGKYGVATLLKKGLSFKSIDLKNEILLCESRTNFIYINELKFWMGESFSTEKMVSFHQI